MLYFSVAGLCQLYRFLRVNLEDSILDRILDFGQHVVTVAVDHLYEFADLSPRIRQVFFSPRALHFF